MFENLTDRILFVVSSLSPYHRHQYLCRKAYKFLSKVLPDIVELTKMGIRSSLNGGTEPPNPESGVDTFQTGTSLQSL